VQAESATSSRRPARICRTEPARSTEGVVYNSDGADRRPGGDRHLAARRRRHAVAGGAASTTRPSRDRSRSRNGYYKFDLNFSDPACPSGSDYLIAVTPPRRNEATSAGYSQIIPPPAADATTAFSVLACPGGTS